VWANVKSGISNSITDRATDDMYGVPAGMAGDNPADAATDKGKVCLPKMFRRLVSYKETPRGATSPEKFLGLPSHKSDWVIELTVFRTLTTAQRAHPVKLAKSSLVKLKTLVNSGNKLTKAPENLVFVEEPANLKNNTGLVTSWNDQGKPVKVL